MKKYIEYSDKEITREILDSIKAGDYIRCNDWKRAMKVYGVSENYLVVARKAFGKWIYSVCDKKGYLPFDKEPRRFSFGPDNRIFGFLHDHAYEFDNAEFVKDYLEAFENGSCELSMRRSCVLNRLEVCHAEP